MFRGGEPPTNWPWKLGRNYGTHPTRKPKSSLTGRPASFRTPGRTLSSAWERWSASSRALQRWVCGTCRTLHMALGGLVTMEVFKNLLFWVCQWKSVPTNIRVVPVTINKIITAWGKIPSIAYINTWGARRVFTSGQWDGSVAKALGAKPKT